MAKSKYQLRIKGMRKRGKYKKNTNPTWLRTRHRIRKKLLR